MNIVLCCIFLLQIGIMGLLIRLIEKTKKQENYEKFDNTKQNQDNIEFILPL